MAALVTLKRFDGPVQADSQFASAGAADGSPLQTSPVETSAPDLDPVPVHSSIKQEKAAELQRDLEVKQRKLAQILQSLSTELNAAKAKLAVRMADVIADSTLDLLPTLLDNGFAQELSAAIVQIASAIAPEQITLQVHPNDHEPVVDALQTIASPHPITVEKDASMIPGNVRLSWSDGGAEVDKFALLNHAVDLLETRITSLVSGKNHHEY